MAENVRVKAIGKCIPSDSRIPTAGMSLEALRMNLECLKVEY